MGTLTEAIRQRPLVSDGAMGTMLHAAGLSPGACPESWNLTRPDAVRAVHHAYAAAGADILVTNSLGGNRLTLARHGLADQVDHVNKTAALLARQAADDVRPGLFVLGSIGPTGAMLEPLGDLTPQRAHEAFAEQASALCEAGVDGLLIETFFDLEEALCAIEGARAARCPQVLCTITFDVRARTLMGLTPRHVAERLAACDLTAWGANCGTGPAEMLAVVREMHHAFPDQPLVAQANAGLPQVHGGETQYPVAPAEFASYAGAFLTAGVRILGACCGSTPEHVAALAQRVAAEASRE